MLYIYIYFFFKNTRCQMYIRLEDPRALGWNTVTSGEYSTFRSIVMHPWL